MPRYFGARNERECGTLSFLWTALMMFRWPMMMGFALLGILLVSKFFPDQSAIAESAALIKANIGDISKERWDDVISQIIYAPENFNASFISKIKDILQTDWEYKLHLISFDGTVNTENIVPAVILYNFPAGVRGIFLVTFVSAALSTFNSSLNKTTAYFTRDIYQRYIRPVALNKELIWISYAFIGVLVYTGYLFAYNIQSINQIWAWIIMGLGGGLAIPSALKFYWWRYNGSGYAIGTTIGIGAAFFQFAFFPQLPDWQQFLIISGISLIATITGTLLTTPTDENVLSNFYNNTRPFGFWKPFLVKLSDEVRKSMIIEHKHDLISVPFVLGWQVTLFLIPMQLMIRAYYDFYITLTIFICSLLGMYWFWYRNLSKSSAVMNRS